MSYLSMPRLEKVVQSKQHTTPKSIVTAEKKFRHHHLLQRLQPIVEVNAGQTESVSLRPCDQYCDKFEIQTLVR